MARGSKALVIEGEIFDADVARKINGAIREGLDELGDTAAGILAGFVAEAGFVKTGRFLRSIDSQHKGDDDGGVGYVKVMPTDVWAGTIFLGKVGTTKKGKDKIGVVKAVTHADAKGRPTRTWFETGMRGGKKLRTGIGGFSKTATRVNSMSYQHLEDKIAAVLE